MYRTIDIYCVSIVKHVSKVSGVLKVYSDHWLRVLSVAWKFLSFVFL